MDASRSSAGEAVVGTTATDKIPPEETLSTDEDENLVTDYLQAVRTGLENPQFQVQALNFWANLPIERDCPQITALDLQAETSFRPFSVLLDLGGGADGPAISFLGEQLADRCGVDRSLALLRQAPEDSLLALLPEHYREAIVRRRPVSFSGQLDGAGRGDTQYRGVVLPFISEGGEIDHVYAVITWQEAAEDFGADAEDRASGVLLLEQEMTSAETSAEEALLLDHELDEPATAEPGPAAPSPVQDESGAAHMADLEETLADARRFADAVRVSEDRTRKTLYEAIGRAFDFSLAAAENPEEFSRLLDSAGLKALERAPMTPVTKLVFGLDYDRTRLAEYAAVLSYARRQGLGRGTLGEFLARTNGGLKGVVAAERQFRAQESGRATRVKESPRPGLAKKLRAMVPHLLGELPSEGDEFTLVIARRVPGSGIVVLGEVPRDVPLLERAARKLVSTDE